MFYLRKKPEDQHSKNKIIKIMLNMNIKMESLLIFHSTIQMNWFYMYILHTHRYAGNLNNLGKTL